MSHCHVLVAFLVRVSQLCSFDQHLYWCACTIVFFRFLRSGEFPTESSQSFSIHEHTIIFQNISVSAHDHFKLILRHSKRKASGPAQSIKPYWTGRSVCPFSSLQSFLKLGKNILNSDTLPLFTFWIALFYQQRLLPRPENFSPSSSRICLV